MTRNGMVLILINNLNIDRWVEEIKNYARDNNLTVE